MTISNIYHGGAAAKKTPFAGSSTPSLDEKSKVSATDTTTDYLNNKIVVGPGMTKTILNPGGNEQLQIGQNVDLQHYTLPYGNGSAVAVDVHVPATVNTGWQSNTCGYYIGKQARIKRLSVYCPKFITFAAGQYIRFQLKTFAMDGSRVADINSVPGVNLINYDLVLPNTGGAYQYYCGSSVDLNLLVNAGEMLWCVHCAITANTALGSGAWVHLEEE